MYQFSTFKVNHYKCYDVYCSSIYGESIRGGINSVAKACSNDLRCNGFRHSLKNGFGFLSSSLDVKEGDDDWKLCKFERGKLENISVGRISNE